ncbi:hypothetical protein C9924_00320 [Alloalcanivorax venustensis]|nr:hypothetical protein C9924_00320 [Alloalcanivorax venustensis]
MPMKTRYSLTLKANLILSLLITVLLSMVSLVTFPALLMVMVLLVILLALIPKWLKSVTVIIHL